MLFALPSICAIIIKLLILWKRPFSRPSDKHSVLFSEYPLLILFCALLALNICEVSLFFTSASTLNAHVLVALYHVFYIFSLFSILGIALKSVCGKSYAPVLVFLSSLLAVLIAYPKLSILGTSSIGYSVTRISGPLYYPVVFCSLLSLLCSLILFIWGAAKSIEAEKKLKCKILLFCLAPFAFTTFGVAILMRFGIEINATIITSFTINILLLGLLYSESKYYIPQVLAGLPGTRYFESTETLTTALFDPNIPLEQAKEIMTLEKTRRALELTKGNQTEAAKMLGISRPTICRRIKALENYKGLPKRPSATQQMNEAS